MVEPTEEWNQLYWAFNMPLQMWADHDNWRVLNYMPRKQCCEFLEEEVTKEELPQYCRNAAARLRNLAELFEALGDGKIHTIYYPNETVVEAMVKVKQVWSEE